MQVFLSYWRSDVGGYAGRLTDALRQRLGAKSGFQDVTPIALGEPFTAAIDRALDDSDVVLAAIGPGWLTASTPQVARGCWSPMTTCGSSWPGRKCDIRVVPSLSAAHACGWR